MNKKNCRFIAIGDLTVDRVVDKFGYVTRQDGGGSKFNVISRLALYNNETIVFSGCGNDESGDIAIESLQKCGVDVSKVKRKGKLTKIYQLKKLPEGEYESTKKNWYKEPIVSIDDVEKDIHLQDVIVMDSLNKEDIRIIEKNNNDKVLDIGRIKILEKMSNKEIEENLRGRIQIIQINEKIEQYLKKRLNYKGVKSLYEFLKPKLLIITRGEKGADFIIDGKCWSKEINNPSYEIDATGAGDAFLSVVIDEYYKNIRNEIEIDEKFVNEVFCRAIKVTSKVVSYLGARGDINEIMKKIDIDSKEYKEIKRDTILR